MIQFIRLLHEINVHYVFIYINESFARCVLPNIIVKIEENEITVDVFDALYSVWKRVASVWFYDKINPNANWTKWDV